MKKVSLVLLVLVLTFCCIGCAAAANPWQVVEPKAYNFSDTVTLTVDPETLTETGATFEWHNPGDRALCYNKDFDLEVQVGDGWYFIELDKDLPEELTQLDAGASQDETVYWGDCHKLGHLPDGTYRLIKTFCDLEDYQKDAEAAEKFQVAAEFTIDK